MHEAFNIGLDPSLGLDAGQDEVKHGEGLVHSENLWPEYSRWEGAERFVSVFFDGVHQAHSTETGQPRLLVRLLLS
jgi:hypothetical protein